MATWTTPITWVTGAVTAASFNTEVRDHLNWIKGFADNVTASTAADSGTATRLHILRGTTTSVAYSTGLSGESFNRFQSDAAGKLSWGSGTAAVDVSIERLAANRMGVTGGVFEMKRDTTAADALITGLTTDTASRFTIEVSGEHQWGDGVAAADTVMSRIAVGTLGMASGDDFQLVNGALNFGPAGAWSSSMYEITAGRLQTGQQLRVAQGVITFVKAGVPADADFTITPMSGMLAVDTTNNRLYIRSGAVWRYVALI